MTILWKCVQAYGISTQWFDLQYYNKSNRDLRKILNTVLEISIEFLTEHPTYTLAFQGSMDVKSLQLGRNQRNSAYQQILDKNLESLSDDYKVAGILNGEIVKFEPNTEYEGFLVKRK